MNSLSKKYILLSLCYVMLAAALLFPGVTAFASFEACEHENTVTVEASEGNCYEKGYTDGIFCEDCNSFISGHYETNYKHNETSFRRVEPTCTQLGYTEGIYCELCETFLSGHEEIAKAEHKTELHGAVDYTCTENGFTAGEFCTVCETYVSGHEIIPAAHKEKDIPRQPETCTKVGYTEGVFCEVCETYLSGHEIIPAGHKEIFVSAVPATCTSNGYTEGIYCTVCNEFLSGHMEVPFIDHDFSEKIIDNRHLVHNATVESPAIYSYDCLTCNAISPTLTFKYGERIPIGATKTLKATQTTTSIKLTWSAVGGADGYRIYRYDRTKKKWRPDKDVKGTTVTYKDLTSATIFKFAVRGYVVEDGEKSFSHTYTTVEAATKPTAPVTVKAKQTASAIKLSWSKVKGASGYRIYYRSGGKWKVCVKSTTERSHTFRNLSAGKSIRFAVRPYVLYSSGMVLGEYKTYLAATTPAKVKTTAVSQAPRYITLTWTKVKADAYRVYYKRADGKYKLYKSYGEPQKLMFSGLKSGTKYTFYVRAVKKTSGGNIYGAYSPVSVTVR